MVDRLSRNQAEKLGKRLAAADQPTVDDLRLLEQWRAQHGASMHAVEEGLRRLGLKPTSRPKTTGTIVEKLRREAGMSLCRMEDIAGVRVVLDATRRGQDDVVERIVEAFPDNKLRDRRESPSFGYRAVHVIAKVEGYLVEVQVRTALQNLWAQMFERLADEWGRQMRYGGEPDDPDAEAAPKWRRRDVAEFMQLTSEYIDAIEEHEFWLERTQATVARLREAGQDTVELKVGEQEAEKIDLRQEEADIDEKQRQIDTRRQRLADELRRLAETFGIEVP